MNMFYKITTITIFVLVIWQLLGNFFKLDEVLLPFTHVHALSLGIEDLWRFAGIIYGRVVFGVYWVMVEYLHELFGDLLTALASTCGDIFYSISPVFNFKAFWDGFYITVVYYVGHCYSAVSGIANTVYNYGVLLAMFIGFVCVFCVPRLINNTHKQHRPRRLRRHKPTYNTVQTVPLPSRGWSPRFVNKWFVVLSIGLMCVSTFVLRIVTK